MTASADMLSPRSYDTLFGPKHQDDLTYKCHRLTKPLNASLPVPPIANSSSSILSDVAIGIPVALEWVMNGRPDVSDTSMRTVQKLCAGGNLLACAVLTWLPAAGPALELLLLAGCSTGCFTLNSSSARHPECARITGKSNVTACMTPAESESKNSGFPGPDLRAAHVCVPRAVWQSGIHASISNVPTG